MVDLTSVAVNLNMFWITLFIGVVMSGIVLYSITVESDESRSEYRGDSNVPHLPDDEDEGEDEDEDEGEEEDEEDSDDPDYEPSE